MFVTTANNGRNTVIRFPVDIGYPDNGESSMSSTSTSQSPTVPVQIQRSWRYLIGAGIIVAALGVLAIFTPFVTGIALSIMLGALLVVGALVHAAHAFSARGWKGSIWQVVLAVVYALAGISLLANPVVGLATLTVLLIAYFVVEGIVEVVMGLRMRPESRWGWMTASGVISLLLAVLLWTGLPSTALWAVGLLFGVSLLSTGLSMVGIGMAGRKASSMDEEMPGTEQGAV
jgi:uncharacterized membrane protein HdeD (DUF308 family)